MKSNQSTMESSRNPKRNLAGEADPIPPAAGGGGDQGGAGRASAGAGSGGGGEEGELRRLRNWRGGEIMSSGMA